MTRDIIRDIYPYIRARVALKPLFAQVETLRDAGKRRDAAKLLRSIEASRDFAVVTRFEQTYMAN